MEFPSIPELKLDDEFFQYKDKIVKYEDVSSIDFGASVTKHRVNLVPAGTTYEAKLTVSIANGQPFEIKPKKGFFGGLKEAGFNELQRVNAALSYMSFNYRLELYENDLAKTGMFKMDGYEFHKNGDLSKNSKFITNLKDGSHNFLLGAFTVTISKKRKSLGERLKASWSGESTIYIGSDRDCFIYLLKDLYGLFWSTEQIPEKRIDRRKIYYETVLRLGAWLSAVDGQTDPRELEQLKNFFKIEEGTIHNAALIYNEQLMRPKSLSFILKPFISEFRDAEEVKETIYVGMVSVAFSDGIFHPLEKKALQELSSIFNFNYQRLERIFSSFGLDYDAEFRSKASNSKEQENDGSTKNYNSLRARHLSVLELEPSATDEDIRAKYKDLVKRYHPDVLRSKGLPENEMQHAQQLLRQVMASYDWLLKPN